MYYITLNNTIPLPPNSIPQPPPTFQAWINKFQHPMTKLKWVSSYLWRLWLQPRNRLQKFVFLKNLSRPAIEFLACVVESCLHATTTYFPAKSLCLKELKVSLFQLALLQDCLMVRIYILYILWVKRWILYTITSKPKD